MTIEIARREGKFQYRQNPWNPRCLDWRINKHGARWEHYDNYPTTMAAIEALMAIKREAKPVSK